jgi:hypothetical protein
MLRTLHNEFRMKKRIQIEISNFRKNFTMKMMKSTSKKKKKFTRKIEN